MTPLRKSVTMSPLGDGWVVTREDLGHGRWYFAKLLTPDGYLVTQKRFSRARAAEDWAAELHPRTAALVADFVKFASPPPSPERIR